MTIRSHLVWLSSGKQDKWILTRVFAVTAVIGSMPRSAAQEHLALRLPRFQRRGFLCSVLGYWVTSEVWKISPERSFVGSRAVPYHDAELITCNYNYSYNIKGSIIVKKISMLVAGLFVLGAMAQSAPAQNLVAFNGGIGDITTGSTNTSVFGVAAAGQIWVIRDLQAEVKVGGPIEVNGRGLLLGAGNAIGGNASASVFATLFCANDGDVQHSTNAAGVPLQENGDFRIQDSLSPAPPDTCTSPVLLIRSTAGAWFAAGIPFVIPSTPLPHLSSPPK